MASFGVAIIYTCLQMKTVEPYSYQVISGASASQAQVIFSVGAEKRVLQQNKLEGKKTSVSITLKFCVNVAKCLFLIFSDKKVYNDQKFCNRNYFNQ